MSESLFNKVADYKQVISCKYLRTTASGISRELGICTLMKSTAYIQDVATTIKKLSRRVTELEQFIGLTLSNKPSQDEGKNYIMLLMST